MIQEYPIVCILGRRGTGKSLLGVKLALEYHNKGIPIYSNYNMTIPHYPIDFTTLASFPDYLHDCVLLIDEIHVGADAYDFFSSRTRDITSFATQIRKRRITMYYMTQVWTLPAKRLRQQTDYIFECSKLEYANRFRVDMFDRYEIAPDDYIGSIIYDGTPYYPMFNTSQLIMLKK